MNKLKQALNKISTFLDEMFLLNKSLDNNSITLEEYQEMRDLNELIYISRMR